MSLFEELFESNALAPLKANFAEPVLVRETATSEPDVSVAAFIEAPRSGVDTAYQDDVSDKRKDFVIDRGELDLLPFEIGKQSQFRVAVGVQVKVYAPATDVGANWRDDDDDGGLFTRFRCQLVKVEDA